MADDSYHQHHHLDAHFITKYIMPLLMVSAFGLGAALLWVVQPQDLRSIGGAGPILQGTTSRDLKTVLKTAVEEGYPVTITETELNHWLARTLILKQGGALAGCSSLERVLVRLEDNRAEVIMVRKLFGETMTVSMFLKIEQIEGPQGVHTEVQLHGGPYGDDKNLPFPPRGGRFGRLVVPQGFLLLVMPSYRKLAGLFRDEIHLGFEEMARSKIEKGRLILSPRPPGEDPPTGTL